MTAALTLAENGFPVHLVEKEAALGGNLRHIYTSYNDKDPQNTLQQLVEQVHAAELGDLLERERRIVDQPNSGRLGHERVGHQSSVTGCRCAGHWNAVKHRHPERP